MQTTTKEGFLSLFERPRKLYWYVAIICTLATAFAKCAQTNYTQQNWDVQIKIHTQKR